jgi:hypothetical protein
LFLLLPLVAGRALGSYFTEFKGVIFLVMGLLFFFALFKGWRKLDPETKRETKKQQRMIVAVLRGFNHEGKSVASSHCIFGFCYGCMLPGSTDFNSSWANWVCRGISFLFTKVSVIVQHRYHHPSHLLLLHGLWEKG